MTPREIICAMLRDADGGGVCGPEQLARYVRALTAALDAQDAPQAPEGFDRPKVLPHEAIVA